MLCNGVGTTVKIDKAENSVQMATIMHLSEDDLIFLIHQTNARPGSATCSTPIAISGTSAVAGTMWHPRFRSINDEKGSVPSYSLVL